MYAFVMHPKSLPKAYRDFIQKTGPVEEPVYRAIRDCNRANTLDIAQLSSYLSNKKGSEFLKYKELSSIIPCAVIHPDTVACLAQNGKATSETFRKTFPLYFSLTLVPYVFLHLQKV